TMAARPSTDMPRSQSGTASLARESSEPTVARVDHGSRARVEERGTGTGTGSGSGPRPRLVSVSFRCHRRRLQLVAPRAPLLVGLRGARGRRVAAQRLRAPAQVALHLIVVEVVARRRAVERRAGRSELARRALGVA